MFQVMELFEAETEPFSVKLSADWVSVQLLKVTVVAVAVVHAGAVAAVRIAWRSCGFWGTPVATATLPRAEAARSSAREAMVVALVPSGLLPKELDAVTELFAETAAVCSEVEGAWVAAELNVFEI